MPYKKKVVKNENVKQITNHDKIQLDIKKDLEDDKKIKPEKVFEGYKPKVSGAKSTKKKTTKKKK
mgnify:CR=1 FL=1